MARKSIKESAAQGASVLQTIASGNAQAVTDVQNVQDVQNVLNAQDVKADKIPMERLNLKIPREIKEYLQAAAYRVSSPRKIVSLTEYLCDLVRADMELHKDD